MTITKTALPVALCLAGWVYLALGAGMDMGAGMGAEMAPKIDPATLIVMWWGMMMAMMIPGAMAHMGPRHGPRFWLGYGAIWFGFSLVVTAVQMQLTEAHLIGAMSMASQNTHLSAALLAVAGLYQFLPIKQRLLAMCRSGGMAGTGYGVICVAITGPLMMLLFVGGVMNMWWIVGLALVTAIEKTRAPAIWVSRAIGVACFVGVFAVL